MDKVSGKTHNSVIARQFARRALIAFIFVFIGFIILCMNIYYLQIKNFNKYQTQSDSNRIKVLPVVPSRGLILDRNGKVLAKNILHWGLYIVPEKVENLQKSFNEIKNLIGLNEKEIEKFKELRKNATRYSPILLKENLSEQQIAIFSVNKHKFNHIEVQPYFKRYYPFGEAFTHILGYVGKINDKDYKKLEKENLTREYSGMHSIGKLGIEKFYEPYLHGKIGFQEVEVNSRGKVVRNLTNQAAKPGENIHLTIDSDLQQFIFDLLHNQKGAVVVLNAKDSSILAMVSTPSYNNNLFIDGISSKQYTTLLRDFNTPLVARAVQGIYPPASTVKPFMGIAALTEGVITENTTIFDPGYWIIPNSLTNAKSKTKFRDWKRWGHGETNLNKAIMESSDTYFYDLAYNLSIDRMYPWMSKFGFGKKTGIDIGEEYSALMPSRDWKLKTRKAPWIPGDTVNAGIGQGFWSATPLQLAKATAILVNNGKVNTPHFLQKIVGKDNIETFYEDKLPFADITNVRKEHWNAIKTGMYNVAHGRTGTARKIFANSPYKVGGKTGTAQVIGIAQDQEYDADNIKKEWQDHALFIGFAPFENPKVVVSVILENAGGGSSNAAPIAKEVFDYVLLYSKIFKSKTRGE